MHQSSLGGVVDGGRRPGGLRWRRTGLPRAVDDHLAVYDELVRGRLEEELDTLQEGSLAG